MKQNNLCGGRIIPKTCGYSKIIVWKSLLLYCPLKRGWGERSFDNEEPAEGALTQKMKLLDSRKRLTGGRKLTESTWDLHVTQFRLSHFRQNFTIFRCDQFCLPSGHDFLDNRPHTIKPLLRCPMKNLRRQSSAVTICYITQCLERQEQTQKQQLLLFL